MTNSLKIIIQYYKFSHVKLHLIILEFIILLIPSILSIISPLLTAKIISSLTVFDFKNAKLLLFFDLLIIIITSILYFISHYINSINAKKIFNHINNFIFNSVKDNPNIEKINSSIISDIFTISNFNKNFLHKLCFFIKSIIIIGIIIYYDIIIGIILISISILLYLLFKITNKKIKQNTLIIENKQIELLKIFNSIQYKIKNISSIDESTIKINKSYYMKFVNDLYENNNSISLLHNINDNFINLILKITVFGLTFYLISLVKSTSLSLYTYLVLTPYLTSSAQNLIEFFSIFPEIVIIENIINKLNKLKYKNGF